MGKLVFLIFLFELHIAVKVYGTPVCVCETGRVGHMSQCSSTSSREDGDDTCRRKGDLKDCSGQGHCVCGECVCMKISKSEKYYGQYCDCDNFSCKYHNRRMCNGHGTCDCGTCRCELGWEGSACECPSSPALCTPPAEDVCSGHGHCECGRCQCDKDQEGKSYYGTYCEQL